MAQWVQSLSAIGSVQYGNQIYPVLSAPINASSNGDNVLVAGVAGKAIIVLQYVYERADAVTITIKSEDGTVLDGPCGPSVVGGGKASGFCPVGWFRTTTLGDDLIMNLSSGVQVGGSLVYIRV